MNWTKLSIYGENSIAGEKYGSEWFDSVCDMSHIGRDHNEPEFGKQQNSVRGGI